MQNAMTKGMNFDNMESENEVCTFSSGLTKV
jgi:hypothetical protein